MLLERSEPSSRVPRPSRISSMKGTRSGTKKSTKNSTPTSLNSVG